MLEVLFAGTVLALATFTVLGLLRLSDEMSYRAKVDSKLSQIMKARSSLLVTSSFQSLRDKVESYAGNADHLYRFQNGVFTSTHISNPQFHSNNSLGFPFVETVDPFSAGPPEALKYLLSGKPLPGSNTYRDIFPFVEQIILDFDATPASASEVSITYTIYWINEFYRSTEKADATGTVDYQKMGQIDFYFTKYDPTKF